MTKAKNDKPIPHGTLGGYTNHGCRCDQCLEAHRDYQRNYMNDNPHQKRLAVLRERVRYWRREVELREYRKQFHGPQSAKAAREQLARYEAMYEEARTEAPVT